MHKSSCSKSILLLHVPATHFSFWYHQFNPERWVNSSSLAPKVLLSDQLWILIFFQLPLQSSTVQWHCAIHNVIAVSVMPCAKHAIIVYKTTIDQWEHCINHSITSSCSVHTRGFRSPWFPNFNDWYHYEKNQHYNKCLISTKLELMAPCMQVFIWNSFLN